LKYLLALNVVFLLSTLRRVKIYFPLYFYLFPLNFLSFGFYTVCEQKGYPNGSWVNILTPTWFVIGFYVADIFKLKKKPIESQNRLVDQRAFNTLVGLFTSLAVYHFYKVGLVVFSRDIETARFQSLGNAGLFGLPGRVVLFGLILLSFVSLIHRERLSRKSVIFCLSTYVLTNFLTGFKGALVEVATVLMIGLFFSNPRILGKYKSRLIIVLSLAVGYSIWTASLYVSFNSNLNFDLEYIYNRLTTIPASAQWFALKIQEEVKSTGGALSIDTNYFLRKYFGLGEGSNFAFDQIVSSLVYNTPRSASSFLVPVTTGGTTYLLASFVWWLVPIIVLILGFTFTRVIQSLTLELDFYRTVLLSTLFLIIPVFMSNGAGAYLIINWIVMIIFTLSIYSVSSFVFKHGIRNYSIK